MTIIKIETPIRRYMEDWSRSTLKSLAACIECLKSLAFLFKEIRLYRLPIEESCWFCRRRTSTFVFYYELKDGYHKVLLGKEEILDHPLVVIDVLLAQYLKEY